MTELTSATSPALLQTDDGLELAADVWRPAKPRAVVVVVHGFTAHRREPAVVAMADALLRDGYAVVVFDARGHGDSPGSCTLGDDERLDVAAAVTAARQLSDRIIVLGASMGAIAALRFAADARADEIDGVVTVSCPARWQLLTLRSALAAVVTQTPPGRWFLRRQVGVRVAPGWRRPESPESLAARVACPIAIVHGLADRFMPALEASRLHERAPGRRRLDLVPAMGHAFDEAGIATIVAAVAWCLAVP